ncbi:MAG: rod shape-determining protein MreC [Thermodesulfobacteriota bacterium]|nr:rod shape-determining protein MreC [Thermodesulfobacteriota bacterium]
MRKKSTRKRASRFRTFRLVLLGGVLLTVGLIFLVFVFGNQEVGPIHKLLLETAGPVQKVVSKATAPFHSLKKEYLDLLSVREDKEQLRHELQECRAAVFKNREAMATNARLRKLLDFKESSGLPTVAAQVIGKDPSLWFRSVIIDRGSSDGVVKGMPVVTGDGIVGQIYSTSPSYAKVLLSIAPSSALDVLLQESRVRGILKGTGDNTYRLEYVLKTVEISEGDHVVTAGYGGLFPTGLPVGVVSRVIKKRLGTFLDIEVTPAVDFETLEGLLVIEQERPAVE